MCITNISTHKYPVKSIKVHMRSSSSNIYVFKLMSKLSQTCKPDGRQAKICDEPKRENGVKNMMFASKIDVQAAEEYDGNNSDN